jgi:hypothetical protein
MKKSLPSIPWLLTALLAACSSSTPPSTPKDTPDAAPDVAALDAATDIVATPDKVPTFDVPPRPDTTMVCMDTDRDGLSDDIEGAPRVDTDRDGMPDFMDTDSDDDGYPDSVEADRSYPMFDTSRMMLACGMVGNNCDGALADAADTIPNFRDLDSDNDGLTDREERTGMTDPCSGDTDGDGVSDLIERAAMSNPRDRMSGPPSNALYVVLPYYPPGRMGPHEFREFTFSTRIRQADVFFLVDNSSSMGMVIANLRTNLRSVIVPGVQRAIPDVQMGVGSFDSMPVPPQGCPGRAGPPSSNPRCLRPTPPTTAGDYTLWIRQPNTADATAVQRAFDTMRTIDDETMMEFVGADEPECQTEAAFQILDGAGSRGHESDPAALLSVRNANDPNGNGWVPAVNLMRDCGARGTERFGWGCFNDGRVPIVVLASDANWYDGCAAGSPTTPGGIGRTCSELIAAYNRRGAFFIGIDVGDGVEGRTYRNASVVARMTRTLNGMGSPIVFGPGRDGVSGVSAAVVDAIATIAGQSRQDITTRVTPDAMAMGLPMGRTTANFIRAVTPLRGDPGMPTGFDRLDATTFFNVSPTTRVTFRADFYNDFVEGGTTARLFTATIDVLGRGGTVVDTRPVFIVVPAQGGIVTPG